MVLRPTRGTPTNPSQDFVDPLSNYQQPTYSDELEKSLSEDHVTTMVTAPFRTIRPDTTIAEAMKIMADQDIACLMVAEDQKLVGVFTERDILNKVSERFEQVKNYPVSLVMTHGPGVAQVTDSPAKVLNLMAVAGFRHVPLVDLDDHVVGIVGPRRVTAYLKRFLFPD